MLMLLEYLIRKNYFQTNITPSKNYTSFIHIYLLDISGNAVYVFDVT